MRLLAALLVAIVVAWPGVAVILPLLDVGVPRLAALAFFLALGGLAAGAITTLVPLLFLED